MTTDVLNDDMYYDNQSNGALLDCRAVAGQRIAHQQTVASQQTIAHLLFAKEVIFDNEPAVHFKIKIHCPNEDMAYANALEKQKAIATTINDIIKLKVGDFGGLKDLTITRGSINIEGFLGWFDGAGGYRGYRDLKEFISDIFSIIPDLVRALANLFNFIVRKEPITEETVKTSLSATGATLAGVVLAPIVGIFALPIAVAIYKFFK
jgi:hypothetical protein